METKNQEKEVTVIEKETLDKMYLLIKKLGKKINELESIEQN